MEQEETRTWRRWTDLQVKVESERRQVHSEEAAEVIRLDIGTVDADSFAFSLKIIIFLLLGLFPVIVSIHV